MGILPRDVKDQGMETVHSHQGTLGQTDLSLTQCSHSWVLSLCRNKPDSWYLCQHTAKCGKRALGFSSTNGKGRHPSLGILINLAAIYTFFMSSHSKGQGCSFCSVWGSVLPSTPSVLSAWWHFFSPEKTGREASGADQAWEQVKCLLGKGEVLPEQLKIIRGIMEIVVYS